MLTESLPVKRDLKGRFSSITPAEEVTLALADYGGVPRLIGLGPNASAQQDEEPQVSRLTATCSEKKAPR